MDDSLRLPRIVQKKNNMKLNEKDTERINWTNSHALLGSIKTQHKIVYVDME